MFIRTLDELHSVVCLSFFRDFVRGLLQTALSLLFVSAALTTDTPPPTPPFCQSLSSSSPFPFPFPSPYFFFSLIDVLLLRVFLARVDLFLHVISTSCSIAAHLFFSFLLFFHMTATRDKRTNYTHSYILLSHGVACLLLQLSPLPD